MALLATRQHKVLVDIGTGIQYGAAPGDTALSQRDTAAVLPFLEPVPPRRLGADVRLIVPGTGCLVCVGAWPATPVRWMS